MKRKPKPIADPVARFPIAGIGASAGGLEAFAALLGHLPADTGIGFVLIQHLDPAHESALSQLLARSTLMPVTEVTPNLPVAPNHVYVIPPNTRMAIVDGVLKLSARQKSAPQRSIDFFLESLARDQGGRAIGVILSGTASDGTQGLEAIRAAGGITFAQDQSARYDSMPRSAVAANCVDFVLPPEDIATELARIARHPSVAGGTGPAPAADGRAPGARRVSGDDGIRQVLLLLRSRRGIDFSLYRTNTIQRRIRRRMVLNRQATPGAYARFLRDQPAEIDALYADLLINVTAFFRNADAFDALRAKVFPALLARRGENPLRIWVPGCSTGQEAYSIAMALVECSRGGDRRLPPQIFATDLNESLLEKARAGRFTRAQLANVSRQRIRRFFDPDGDGFRVSKALRSMCIFAKHNLINDPPFSRMDLISCRNVLIYLEPGAQQRILSSFHYALAPEGFLFLGSSESPGPANRLFEPADKKQKIFSKESGAAPGSIPRLFRAGPAPATGPKSPGVRNPPEKGDPALSAQREADHITINQFAPPGVLINAELQILQFRGDTSAYLKQPAGPASFDVLKMARDDLMLPLRAAINEAKAKMKPVRSPAGRAGAAGRGPAVEIEVMPLNKLGNACFLVLFRESDRGDRTLPPLRTPSPGPTGRAAGAGRRIRDLERELAEARDYNQSLREEHEGANEELQSQSEEVQSANEELQSINEELETSKEEMESANEELTTVNQEMVNRNAELSRLNSDLHNLQVNIQSAVVVLGRDLLIRDFSPMAEKLFGWRDADAVRSLGQLRDKLNFPALEQMIAEAIDTVSTREQEVQDRDGHWYSLRIRPYMTLDNKIDGAVLVALDIDKLKHSEREITAARNFAEAILRTIRYPLVILTEDLRVKVANAAFYATFKVRPPETEGRAFYDLGNGQWNIPKLRGFLDEILPRNSFFDDFEVTHDFEHIGRRTMLLTARRLETGDERGAPKGILLSIDDITDSTRLENVRLSEIHYRRLFEESSVGMLVLDLNTQRVTDANPAMTDLTGYTRGELLRRELWEIGLAADAPASLAIFDQLEKENGVRIEGLQVKTKAGERRFLSMSGSRYDEEDRPAVQLLFR